MEGEEMEERVKGCATTSRTSTLPPTICERSTYCSGSRPSNLSPSVSLANSSDLYIKEKTIGGEQSVSGRRAARRLARAGIKGKPLRLRNWLLQQ